MKFALPSDTPVRPLGLTYRSHPHPPMPCPASLTGASVIRSRLLCLLVLGVTVASASEPETLPAPRVDGPELLPLPRVDPELLPIPRVKLPEKLAFIDHVKPFLTTYCIGCHGGPKPKGKLALDKYSDE